MGMIPLFRAAGKAVHRVLKVRAGERLLLVTDKQKIEIAEALAYWARKAGAETTTYLMTETLRPIASPTRMFRTMIAGASVVVYMLDARIEEKPFRSFMVRESVKRGRICMMPGITRDMMERLVNVDFDRMDGFTRKVIRALDGADDVLVENAEGTHIRFSVKGRKWKNDNGDISRKGGHGNLPAGECFTCPVEQTFTGTIVIRLIDNAPGRGTMEFREGRLVKWSGKGVAAVVRNIGTDPTGLMIGEFGIGTNRGARLSPNMLEAEKAFGTVHFAIGDSYGIGRNRSPHHYDALVGDATIRVGGTFIAREGTFLIR